MPQWRGMRIEPQSSMQLNKDIHPKMPAGIPEYPDRKSDEARWNHGPGKNIHLESDKARSTLPEMRGIQNGKTVISD